MTPDVFMPYVLGVTFIVGAAVGYVSSVDELGRPVRDPGSAVCACGIGCMLVAAFVVLLAQSLS